MSPSSLIFPNIQNLKTIRSATRKFLILDFKFRLTWANQIRTKTL